VGVELGDSGDVNLALRIGNLLEDFTESGMTPQLHGWIGVPHKGDEHGKLFGDVELVGADGSAGGLHGEEGGEGHHIFGKGCEGG
jgi:hypothetical protein